MDNEREKILSARNIELEQQLAILNRELKIEAALDEVRNRALAMHKSEELTEVIRVVFEQLRQFSVSMDTACIMTFNQAEKGHTTWAANLNQFSVSDIYVPFFKHPMHEVIYEAQKVAPGFIDKTWPVEVKNSFWQWAFDHTDYGLLSDEIKKAAFDFPGWGFTGPVFKYSATLLVSYSERTYSDDEKEIIRRIGKVFEQSYIRFLDLQKAEAQAREAQIEAALEKVRSRSLQMQTSNELKDVVAVVFEKLQELDFAMNDGAAIVITFIKNSKDHIQWIADTIRAFAAFFRVPYSDHSLPADIFNARENGVDFFSKLYTFEEKNTYFKYLFENANDYKALPDAVKELLLSSKDYGMSIAFEKNSAILIPTNSGRLLSETEKEILKRFSKVFEQAYVRFLDLQKAEAQALQAEQDLLEIKAARKKAEDTLMELKATQKQLIQSEKMASLGELTAGIAHEIQNPLNFVNNFSEVSNELVDELKVEKNKSKDERDAQLEEDILNDIATNLQKINHHGKRADAIVKGMLQHSRSTSGQKESTDINALCDEYVRLSYHGLRAKDNTFNATINTNFDNSVGAVNIVPQDIGRVILNLLTNAFYAVNEKAKMTAADSYEPTVTIATKKSGNQVFITVSDNGMGIPQKVVDKIFQPFFTTKPTGQGTGLGLSLSYDIIKAHGGEIKVETTGHQGSEFIIKL